MPPSWSRSQRHPANVVRVDQPDAGPSDEPDDRYRRAARALAEWRSGAILHKDPHPSDLRLRATPRPRTTGRSDVSWATSHGCAWRNPAPARASGRPKATRRGGHRRALPADARDGDQLAPGHRPVRRSRRRERTNTSPPRRSVRPTSMSAMHARRPPPPVGHARRRRRRPGRGDDWSRRRSRDPCPSSSGRATYDGAVRYRDERRMSRSCEEDPAVRLRPRPAHRALRRH